MSILQEALVALNIRMGTALSGILQRVTSARYSLSNLLSIPVIYWSNHVHSVLTLLGPDNIAAGLDLNGISV